MSHSWNTISRTPRFNRSIPGFEPTILALFGPTGVGKTAVAVAVAERLRERGEDPVAVSCDAIQVYRGLETLSGAATADDRARLEHRLLGFVEIDEEFSAGRFAALAQAEIDGLLAAGRRPIVVGGTGLYLRAALAELDLRPPVEPAVRAEVERQLADRGPEAMHAELPARIAATVHPRDSKRIARALELERAGIEPPSDSEQLWTAAPRRPACLVGLTTDRAELGARIDLRVDEMVAAGVVDEVRSAVRAGASRTARAALGFEELLAGDVDAIKRAHRAYARRQLTWMRRMPGVTLIDRTGLSDQEVAREVVGLLGENGP
jgi:tRNA dimethylallyltransferase